MFGVPTRPTFHVAASSPSGLTVPGSATAILDLIVPNPPVDSSGEELMCEEAAIQVVFLAIDVVWTDRRSTGWEPRDLAIGSWRGARLDERDQDMGDDRYARVFLVSLISPQSSPIEYGSERTFRVTADTTGAMSGDTIVAGVSWPMGWCVRGESETACYYSLLLPPYPIYGEELEF